MNRTWREVVVLLLVLSLVTLSGCGVSDGGPTTLSIPTGGDAPTRAPLKLDVDDDTFFNFVYAMRSITDAMAATHIESPDFRAYYFEYLMPEVFSADSDDLTSSYLAGRLLESKSAGYDFSDMAGKKATGCVLLYTNLGISYVYIGLSGTDGRIQGLWEDTFNPPDDVAGINEHWSVLNLEITDLEWYR